MVHFSSLQGAIQIKLNQVVNRIENLSDDELEQKLKSGFEECTKKDIKNAVYGDHPRIGFWDVFCANNTFYEGLAAKEILQERHGENYVLNLVGYRKPETFIEKARYFFSGEFPALNPSNSSN